MPEPSGRTFVLDVDTDPAAEGDGVARLRLSDGEGRHLGAHQVVLAAHGPALWQGLFDTRAYVRTYAGSVRFTTQPATAEDLLEQIGVFLGERVLGPEITAALRVGIAHRSLLVRQKAAPEDRLAAAFARVPWEIARPAAGAEPLLRRNLVVRMETPGPSPASLPPPPAPGETLRVLLVYAEAPGSRPLAMRLEREQLLELFYDRVMPQRRVRVEALCHGVTRKALREAVHEAKGFHVVHWSGHGHHNLLELVGEDGEPDRLTGGTLVDLLREAGGFLPRLVFLSACLSGTLVRDRATLEAALRESGPGAPSSRQAEPEPAGIAPLVAEPPGYTGTALALLGAGVPQVVAMRYEVGDDYARDLAGLFYHRLFADSEPADPASALSLARGELFDQGAPEHAAVDHATPLLFGREAGALPLSSGRSPALSRRRPQPQPLLPDSRELDRPAELVGRGEALGRLRTCLETGRPAVALVQGLAGLGKTALVAEAVHLWHRRFDHVLAFQSKPLPLALDDVLRRLDERLTLNSPAYREACEQNPNARVHLPVGLLPGEARWRQMRDNLLEALRNERLLLVLDNFETQLEGVARGDGCYACEDPEWDRLLGHLAEGLPGSGSRLLVTSRHRPAALAAAERALWLPLGPLPMAEAVLFLQGSEALRRLAFGDAAGRELALRLLDVSRGHPLILTRLGALAGERPALAKALDELEAKGLDRLPDVFTPHLSEKQRKEELAYLEDVAVGAVDLLIGRATAPARQLLWVVTLAGEPVPEEVIQAAWPDGAVAPLLAELRAAGLLTMEAERVYGFHELVRERAVAWMAGHPQERGWRTEEEVWVAYGELYAAAFKA
ncbi:MAG TPA: CHAT domain-containing protein, partial [Thermoanaerobaculia bacterium]|nr:CHAT domain-containing protein [Thermoanaerobaculia bacterium]